MKVSTQIVSMRLGIIFNIGKSISYLDMAKNNLNPIYYKQEFWCKSMAATGQLTWIKVDHVLQSSTFLPALLLNVIHQLGYRFPWASHQVIRHEQQCNTFYHRLDMVL